MDKKISPILIFALLFVFVLIVGALTFWFIGGRNNQEI
jgi:flagellar basal body-associated protein FliL